MDPSRNYTVANATDTTLPPLPPDILDVISESKWVWFRAVSYRFDPPISVRTLYELTQEGNILVFAYRAFVEEMYSLSRTVVIFGFVPVVDWSYRRWFDSHFWTSAEILRECPDSTIQRYVPFRLRLTLTPTISFCSVCAERLFYTELYCVCQTETFSEDLKIEVEKPAVQLLSLRKIATEFTPPPEAERGPSKRISNPFKFKRRSRKHSQQVNRAA